MKIKEIAKTLSFIDKEKYTGVFRSVFSTGHSLLYTNGIYFWSFDVEIPQGYYDYGTVKKLSSMESDKGVYSESGKHRTYKTLDGKRYRFKTSNENKLIPSVMDLSTHSFPNEILWHNEMFPLLKIFQAMAKENAFVLFTNGSVFISDRVFLFRKKLLSEIKDDLFFPYGVFSSMIQTFYFLDVQKILYDDVHVFLKGANGNFQMGKSNSNFDLSSRYKDLVRNKTVVSFPSISTTTLLYTLFDSDSMGFDKLVVELNHGKWSINSENGDFSFDMPDDFYFDTVSLREFNFSIHSETIGVLKKIFLMDKWDKLSIKEDGVAQLKNENNVLLFSVK